MRAHGTRYSSAGWADSVKSATRLAISRPTGHSGVVAKDGNILNMDVKFSVQNKKSHLAGQLSSKENFNWSKKTKQKKKTITSCYLEL